VRERCEVGRRLLVAVETAHGSGDFQVDLGCGWTSLAALRRESQPGDRVQLDDRMDSEEVRRCYHPDAESSS